MEISKPIEFHLGLISRNINKWSDDLAIHDELLPLLKIYYNSNPLLTNPLLISTKWSESSILRSSMRLDSSGSRSVVYQRERGRRRYNEDDDHIEPKFRLYTGFYSAIGYSKPEFEHERVNSYNLRDWSVRVPEYDIFVLGVLKKPYRFQIQTGSFGQHIISVLPEDIILLVNSEKFKKPSFFTTGSKYTPTVKRYINNFLKDVENKGLSEIRIVSDQYLSNFIKQGVKVNTNSIIELIELQKRTIDNVFVNLKPELVL